jgi:hypothetical protein
LPAGNVPPRSVLNRYLAARRKPAWMRARIGFNLFRVVLGVLILSTMPMAGRLALLGVIPLVWAAVSFAWIYHVQQSGQSNSASSVAR